jgi:HEAT repeat protein
MQFKGISHDFSSDPCASVFIRGKMVSMSAPARRRELPHNPYAAEPLSAWEARLTAPGPSEARFRAFDAVAQLASAESVCQHALRLLNDPDAELRAAAARWLSTTVRFGRLESDLAAQRDDVVRGLQHALSDADPDVRLEAARGVVRSDPETPRLAEVVCELLAREEAQPTTQAALAELCGWLPKLTERTLPVLELWLAAESGELREAAAAALSRLGDQSSPLETALAVALDDEEPVVREQAAFALGRLPSLTAASREALQHAIDDEDSGVAGAARSALEARQG